MLTVVAWLSLAVAFACALFISVDEIRRPQRMWIMNVVWPVTALYFSVFALWAYLRLGRGLEQHASESASHDNMKQDHMDAPKHARRSPTWQQVALADSHCGAGCTLADIITEFTVFATGATLLGRALYASFLWDFVAAWLLGVVFQYFTIKPMRDLSVAGGLWAAIKADTLSILTFQIGMYAWMALVDLKLFAPAHLKPDQPAYWLMMQIAMICGFVTALPVNRVLVQAGWKEAMG